MGKIQQAGAWDVVLVRGNVVTVTWWSIDAASADKAPSPQWFVGQARQYGGRLRMTRRGDSVTPWNGARTVTYTFWREID